MSKEFTSTIDTIAFRSDRKSTWQVGVDGECDISTLTYDQMARHPFFIMKDHDSAGKVWDRAHEIDYIPAKSTLVQIDAHDDLIVNGTLPDTIDQLRF